MSDGPAIDLSLNEVETIAAKAARGAGLSWGGAEEIGKAARVMATAGAHWDDLLVDLLPAVATGAMPAVEIALLDRFASVQGGARTRFAIAPLRLAALEALGARTYVAATARSREAGAGAGLTDND
ncbi:MAG: DUF3726 domain-containing protein [Proteobacteria bacterium]|nr:DUF3726 domain-containing protein [Pseudomonadota bacterium]